MNEPAFPRQGYETPTDGWKSGQEGMSLRDYFASSALQGVLAQYAGDAPPDRHELAREAYSIADAMLKARGA